MDMAKKSNKSRPKSDLLIKMKTTAMEIDSVGADGVEFEAHNKGKFTGRLYSGMQFDTTEGKMLPDGTCDFSVRFVQMTNKGETVVGQGTGKQDAADKRGRAAFKGQVTTWTGAKRLASLNGATWDFEGIRTMATETSEIRATIATAGGSLHAEHQHSHDHGAEGHDHSM